MLVLGETYQVFYISYKNSPNFYSFHRSLSFPLDPPPTIIHPAYHMPVLWALSSSPNSNHPPNPAAGLQFVNLHPLERTYMNRKRRTKLLVVGLGKGLGDILYIFYEPIFWPARDATRQGHLPGDIYLYILNSLENLFIF